MLMRIPRAVDASATLFDLRASIGTLARFGWVFFRDVSGRSERQRPVDRRTGGHARLD